MTDARGWRVLELRGGAGELHHRDVPDPADAAVWIGVPTRPALVLGSAQRDLQPDHDVLGSLGIDLVRRRSGGGAVLVRPDEVLWVDLIVPRGHDLWDDDVGRAMHWVGDLWVRTLDRLDVAARTHRGPMVANTWGPLVCFAGLGPGEVVDREGRKVVGISQRRQRHAARFQTLVHLDPGGVPAPVIETPRLLGLESGVVEELSEVLGRGVAALAHARSVVLRALLASLGD